jgi:hypothetical protein
MQRKEQPDNYSFVPLGSLVVAPDIPILVPEQSAVWAHLDISLTTVGRVLRLLYKPPALGLLIQTSDDKVRAYRLTPAVASAGFLISPHIESTAAFAEFHQTIDTSTRAPLRVKAIAVTGAPGFSLCYDFAGSRLRFAALKFDRRIKADTSP